MRKGENVLSLLIVIKDWLSSLEEYLSSVGVVGRGCRIFPTALSTDTGAPGYVVRISISNRSYVSLCASIVRIVGSLVEVFQGHATQLV